MNVIRHPRKDLDRGFRSRFWSLRFLFKILFSKINYRHACYLQLMKTWDQWIFDFLTNHETAYLRPRY